eukprot:Em0001g817a
MASKSTSGTIEWNYENIEQLIELYEQRPCFYDTKSKDYFNRDVRSVALQDIAKVLNTTVGKLHQLSSCMVLGHSSLEVDLVQEC